MDFRTKNALQMTFLSHSGTQKNGHSRTPNSNHIPEGLKKRLFRTNFLPNVLKGMIMGVFRNVMLLSIPEWGSRSPSGNAGNFTRNTRFFASETAIFLEYGMESKQGIPSHDYPAATSDLVRCNGKKKLIFFKIQKNW